MGIKPTTWELFDGRKIGQRSRLGTSDLIEVEAVVLLKESWKEYCSVAVAQNAEIAHTED